MVNAEAWRTLYPFESRYFDRGEGIRMHYFDEGPRDGDPVVMVHGNPTWSFYYRNLVLALRGQIFTLARGTALGSRAGVPACAAIVEVAAEVDVRAAWHGRHSAVAE